MIKPPPFKFECPKCGYSRTVRPKSDVLNPLDFSDICPKCGSKMEKKPLSPLAALLGGLGIFG